MENDFLDRSGSEIISLKEKALEDGDTPSGSSPSRSSRDSIDSDENKGRGNWSGRLDFFLSCVGYAVGLGNIWRFPYLCFQSGGGAFLIPYVFFLVVCGIPLFFLEVSFGQFGSLSPLTIWKISPLFKGVGWGMVIVSGICTVYYNVIITWTIYFLYMSLRASLPWSTCDNDWNTANCVLHKSAETKPDSLGNVTDTNYTSRDFNEIILSNSSTTDVLNSSTLVLDGFLDNNSISANKTIKYVSASEEFWQNHVLDLTNGIEDMGSLRWELLICLAVSWIAVFCCLCKGIKSSGKVVYFTATFPYVVLFILLIRGVTLPGAAEGLRFYLVPDWDKLGTFKVWGDAAVQIFYSVGMAWGGLITMSSYNRFHNNCYRDAMVVPVINCSTSVFAGLVVFSVLGFIAQETGQDVANVVKQGPGLVFVAYPEAMAKLPISPLWAVLFFLMLFTVGLDTQFGMFETMTSGFMDEFPNLIKSKVVFTAFACFIAFVCGIPCVMQGGIYVLQIMDWYCATFSLMLLSLAECLVIAWVYGVDRFYLDIEMMIGFKPNIWWKICWKFITPVTIVFVWLFSLTIFAPVSYGSYQYPSWAIVIGWMLGLCSLLPTPIIALTQILRAEGPILQRIKRLAQPDESWGPAVPKYRELYLSSLQSTDCTLHHQCNDSLRTHDDLNFNQHNAIEQDTFIPASVST